MLKTIVPSKHHNTFTFNFNWLVTTLSFEALEVPIVIFENKCHAWKKCRNLDAAFRHLRAGCRLSGFEAFMSRIFSNFLQKSVKFEPRLPASVAEPQLESEPCWCRSQDFLVWLRLRLNGFQKVWPKILYFSQESWNYMFILYFFLS